MAMPTSRLDDLTAKLHARGGRMTPQRMAVIEALLAMDHPTIQDIYARVRHDFPMTSLVTIYRTIALLRDEGEVLEVDSCGPLPHYDGLRPNRHPHLVCTVCGRIADSPDLDVRVLTQDLGQRARGWLLSQDVHFHGVCPECKAQKTRDEAKGG